uniref:Uncharacterized protein n=1 Tax=Spongospora subterranea TaxID=70186 RepID=A0A0H5R985_9EUKA|eukprot:CRZ10316.1 hypothetical protein [Spongospora subterranea]
MCSTMSSPLTIEQRLDRLFASSSGKEGSNHTSDPHGGILDWRPPSASVAPSKSSQPLMKKARHRLKPEEPKSVDEEAVARLKIAEDYQVSKIFAEMGDLGGGALSPVIHDGCARSREFISAHQKTTFAEALKIAQMSCPKLELDDDSSGLEDSDEEGQLVDKDAVPPAPEVGVPGGSVCAPLPDEMPVATSTVRADKTHLDRQTVQLLSKSEHAPEDIRRSVHHSRDVSPMDTDPIPKASRSLNRIDRFNSAYDETSHRQVYEDRPSTRTEKYNDFRDKESDRRRSCGRDRSDSYHDSKERFSHHDGRKTAHDDRDPIRDERGSSRRDERHYSRDDRNSDGDDRRDSRGSMRHSSSDRRSPTRDDKGRDHDRSRNSSNNIRRSISPGRRHQSDDRSSVRRRSGLDLPPVPPRPRSAPLSAETQGSAPSVSSKFGISSSPANICSSASPSVGIPMESPTVGHSNQSQQVQQSSKWKDAVKLKRLADRMKKEAPLSEGWSKKQEMYMSAGLKFLEAAEMYSCVHSYQNTAQYFGNIIHIYKNAGCRYNASIGYECCAAALYRATQVKRKDFTVQANQLLSHVKAHQARNAASANPNSPAIESDISLSLPPKLADMLASYLRHSKCAWDYMDDWDKAKAHRPDPEILTKYNLEVLVSLEDIHMQSFVSHVRRALSSAFTS